MASDDIWRTAWAIVAEHMTRGETDPTKMVADGIRRERAGWLAARDTAIVIRTAEPRHDERHADRQSVERIGTN
ncbi:hypothetical protein ASG39_15865 [Rhizobium sp. Leaf371]|uniref:hypothetical protein n=1 Tax=unclassified Rhizobium TaxID=2613769 RepID=UPI0007145329|nr:MULTISPECIES: hypothetical protein [unclassified Rhizobium]KQS63361.1 hypothetical protein ASG39_15865 [Rhizobium sp. Leaf371]TCM57481.1 hypothetical protein C8J36_102281 [Rhizobium sp. PP-F2F-G48]